MNIRQLGFSLIEILICVVILAVTALALTRFNAVQQQGAVAARERLEATRIAEQLVEGVLAHARTRTLLASAGTVDLGGRALTATDGKTYDATIASTTTSYTVALRFSVVPDWIDDAVDTDDILAFKTQVNVSWTDSSGDAQVVTVSQDVYMPKNDALASAMPAACPPETTTFPVTPDNYYTIGSGNAAKLYYCKQSTGCTGSPVDAAFVDQWTLAKSSCS
ncbi:type IV pilus modification PilV family protein [Chitinibacteraceae bacterium HSL-7]